MDNNNKLWFIVAAIAAMPFVIYIGSYFLKFFRSENP